MFITVIFATILAPAGLEPATLDEPRAVPSQSIQLFQLSYRAQMQDQGAEGGQSKKTLILRSL